ncbi:hypothetical protein pRALTA_0053 (plasmid) [Cupriavidus taiwanensis LMG 19424]|uniref:Uncharacterized protein n=1 Tax=Cupriavidus taiwanensis (strain DSM 17343 / BCRC 17206 / CCUG 44338 / CIP 107171 / LMG 19424 / R1) TaxID=977880 RepID=B2AJS7_CUPTR|nr:hypothetical protein pRALTA_0053 [Cupriavidus taiwanensis LMG 19424]
MMGTFPLVAKFARLAREALTESVTALFRYSREVTGSVRRMCGAGLSMAADSAPFRAGERGAAVCAEAIGRKAPAPQPWLTRHRGWVPLARAHARG